MNTDRFQVISPSNREDYRDLVRGLTKAAWPEFMLHDQIANELWHELLDRFADYQLALYDTDEKRVAAMGNSFPLRWDYSLETLPEAGWDWAFVEAVNNHKQKLSPNVQCAIQVVIRADYQDNGQYPLINIDDYIKWETDESLPFDAWLRVHVRLGGRIIKTCHESKIIRGTRSEWEQWTKIIFPQSGEYIIPSALNPIQMNIEKDEGIYVEPNVWMAHEIS